MFKTSLIVAAVAQFDSHMEGRIIESRRQTQVVSKTGTGSGCSTTNSFVNDPCDSMCNMLQYPHCSMGINQILAETIKANVEDPRWSW